MGRGLKNVKMKSTKIPTSSTTDELLPGVFAVLFGLVLGLTLLKFGTPVILDTMVARPTNVYEWILNSWPIKAGYWLLGGVAMVGLLVARWQTKAPRVIVVLPLVWLGWQFVAGTQTVDAELTAATLKHFTACVVCFYLGLLALNRAQNLSLFGIGLLGGFLVVVTSGLQQHFGGLEETRQYFYQYIYPNLKEVPPEYLKKMSSDRIFATLFYPNALAGVLLMLLPGMLAMLWQAGEQRLTAASRGFLMVVLGLVALACLYWSGSKGGWLLMLLLGMIALLRLPFRQQFKIFLVVGVLLAGLAGFFWKYSGFFERGATSVSARFDYWRAAVETTKENPAFGSGPGTFSIAYKKIKKPESEMARLAHNDYLEQASDSGMVGFLAYLAWVTGSLAFIYRNVGFKGDWLKFSIWLGLLGWSLQSLVEFGLYIPALAWPAFSLLGWLLGRAANQIDNRPPAR